MGTFEELEGEECDAGLRLLVDRIMPLLVSSTSTPPHSETSGLSGGRHGSVYRIRLGERAGRFENG